MVDFKVGDKVKVMVDGQWLRGVVINHDAEENEFEVEVEGVSYDCVREYEMALV